METLTGKRDALQLNTTVNAEAGINPRKSGDDVHPQSSAAANPLSSLLSSLPAGSPFSQLFAMAAAGNNTGTTAAALPKPADLIQQAQALQLLAHLQTVLLSPAANNSSSAGNNVNAGAVGPMSSSPSQLAALNQLINSSGDTNKVRMKMSTLIPVVLKERV